MLSGGFVGKLVSTQHTCAGHRRVLTPAVCVSFICKQVHGRCPLCFSLLFLPAILFPLLAPGSPLPPEHPPFSSPPSPTIWFPAPGCEAPRVASRQLAGDTLACRVLLEDGALAPDSPDVPGDGQACMLNAGPRAPWAAPVAVPAVCPSSEAPLGRRSPSPGPAMASGSAGTQCAVTPGLPPTAGLAPGQHARSLIRLHFLLKWGGCAAGRRVLWVPHL